MLLGSLMPSLSHAIRSGDGASGIEVCTAAGAWRLADVEAADLTKTPNGRAGDAPASLHALEHCPYCSVHVPTLGLLPQAAWRIPMSLDVEVVPRASSAAPRAPQAWNRSRPRGPPRSS